MIYWIIGLSIAIPIVLIIGLKLGKKRAEQAFFEMLFKFGYDSKVKAFRVLNKFAKPNGIVFVGDSITQDYNVYEYYKGIDIYNRGIGGDTTQGLLNRLDVSIDQLKPSKVFLQMGTNDLELLNATPIDVFDNISKVVEHIKKLSIGTKIYVISLYPVNSNLDKASVGKRTNTNIEKTNELLKNLEDVTFINIYDKLLSSGVLNPLYTLEGLHLNQEGYEMVSEILKPFVI